MRDLKKAIASVDAWRTNRSGMAGIEFALIAPILAILLLGVIETGRAYSCYRRLVSATHTISDLIAREKEITLGTCVVGKECMSGIFAIAPKIMGTFGDDETSLALEVLPIHVPNPQSQSIKVYATPENYDGTTLTKCQAVTLEDSMASAVRVSTNGMILVKSAYQYRPLFFGNFFESTNWSYQALAAPRQECVTFIRGSTVTSCSQPC